MELHFIWSCERSSSLAGALELAKVLCDFVFTSRFSCACRRCRYGRRFSVTFFTSLLLVLHIEALVFAFNLILEDAHAC